ncbi:rhodanese-like domain-containing protein [Mucilaginibacter xinganensis]|uniref:Rhodanese domain-containing protein n=1 Tax=Mucilaginibacter xinganensis TaxID=1234841 RepID=A0A223NQ36_9SPHI|nr:rhodanese-like domain-containing protein [Mucilaginibacter xinganensis]ASU32022.1 hypothetical protein MuYL_0119 [Mucilaginibacter xinganensis]
MKKIIFKTFLAALVVISASLNSVAQTSPVAIPVPGLNNPWSNSQLLEPADLAANIKAGGTKTPLILNIGAVEDIKGAQHIGAVSNAETLEKLKKTVAALPKNTEIVIYCGCCPFAKCPNIRPAFNELIKAGFTNVKLLNLPTNLKTNWISKGYPLAKE